MKKYKEMISYLVFGVLTTLINLVVYGVCTRTLGIDIFISNIIAWILSVMFAYVTNKFFVFKSNKIDIQFIIKELSNFIGSRLFSGLVDIIFMFILVNIIFMNDMVAKIISNIIVIVLNYLLSKMLIFKEIK